ncbi:MAG: anti-anti-sigma factor [Actinoplanes sp.]
MSSEVRHRVDHEQAYPLVQLTGVLDADTESDVRAVLLEALSEGPEALVVDVSELEPGTPDAPKALRKVRQDTADWPAANLVLSDPRVHGPWRDTGWPVWPDIGAAFADLGPPDHEHRLSLELEPLVGAARRTRELITEACGRWDLPDLAGPARIVATEMVNNVVAHALTPMVVLLAVHGDGMSVAVRDSSDVIPTYTGGPVPPTAYGGRGMLLIDSVAARWGNLALGTGKVVWALLESEEPPSRPARELPGGASMAGPPRG